MECRSLQVSFVLLLIFLDDFFHSWLPNNNGSTKKIPIFDVLIAGWRVCLMYNVCDHYDLTIFVGPSLETAQLDRSITTHAFIRNDQEIFVT